MAADARELEKLRQELGVLRGGLDDRLGIEFLEATAERVVATMPVDGNTQVYGTLHGGASCVLAESIGSCGAAVHAGPGRMALGIEISATHHRPASGGHITGVATKAHAGRALATYDVVITDEQGRRICTARVTSMLRDRPSRAAPATSDATRTAAATGLLVSRGARQIPHPGGTLLAHLERVHALLGQWGARPDVRLAGLCHAFYGTDGFPTALGEVAHRDELASVIGADVEDLVYFYASCDRGFSYAHLAEDGAVFKDRFTGAVLKPPLPLRRDFAEMTVANELDIIQVNHDIRARHGHDLLALFTLWADLLSEPARRAIRAALP